jgi:hypothetical protein
MSDSDFSGRLPGPVTGPAAAAVVEQRVDGLLQHPLLVVDDDLRRPEVEQPLEAVVAVDHPAVQVVEVDVAKRPPSSWTIGRSSGGITGTTSRIIALGSLIRRPCSSRRLNEATIFSRLIAFCLRWRDSGLRPSRRVDRLAELDLLLVEVDPVDQLLDRVGARCRPRSSRRTCRAARATASRRR